MSNNCHGRWCALRRFRRCLDSFGDRFEARRCRSHAVSHESCQIAAPLFLLFQNLNDIVLGANGFEILVARHDFIHQSLFLGLHGEPILARANLFHIFSQLGSSEGHVILKGHVNIIQLLREFGFSFFRDIPNHINGAFVIPRRHEIGVNFVFIEKSLKIGNLCHDANRAHDRKRSGANPIRHGRHHVTATRGHGIHADRQVDSRFANTYQLRRGQTVLRHGAPRRREQHDALVVTGPGQLDHDRHLFAQQFERRYHDVAVKDDQKGDGSILLSNGPRGERAGL
mmetsp:Transcript_22455/g.48885  ORF Transcript_22455/g.48885 Transcript_22455/m.48885 type:complete len:284 (+) Transcript_22455:314-1165(+)